MSKNRLAMYVFYDKDGIVDRYIIYKLKEMLKIAKRLIVICNGKLTPEGRQTLYEVTDDVITRKNEGFDAWAFKCGFDYLGWDNLGIYDELILFNNSTYGPFYPFETMFDEMEQRKLDFWGITKHGETKDPWGFLEDGIMPEHISTYFYVFSSNLFLRHEFKQYWNNLPVIETHLDAVSRYEIQLTRHFADMGFTWDVYIDTDKKLRKYHDIFLASLIPYELIKNYKLPFMKRKSFSLEYTVNVLNVVTGDSTKKAFEYIKNHTDYDVEMIWENILREMDLVNIKNNLHLNYILPKNYIQHASDSIENVRVALFAYITHECQVEFCVNNANSMPEHADIYITTSSDSMKDCILKEFNKINRKNIKTIVLPNNAYGQDVSALWVALKPNMENYDFICVINDMENSKVLPLLAGRDYTYRLLENILASKDYVVNILHTFMSNNRLGMLFPPPAIHSAYQNHRGYMWEGNYQNTVELAKELGINVPIDNADLVFPNGSMFWFRTAALKKLITHNWSYDDFPPEPMPSDGTLYHAILRIYCYAAQSEGYYSAWSLTDSFASVEITSLNYLLFFRNMQHGGEILKLHKEMKERLDEQHNAFTNSRSWKLTAPLRAIKRLIKRNDVK